MSYPDFLRHIVNPKLSTSLRRKKSLKNHVDEIRKFIIEAENKYRFSRFNGNPENLAEYLVSEDFTLLVKLFKNADSLDILEEILREVREKYGDLPRVVEAVDKALEIVRKAYKEREEGIGEKS